jgi:hypothetical protein
MVVIDTFTSCDKNNIPCGWRKFKEISGVQLKEEAGNHFVSLKSSDDVQGIARKMQHYDVFSFSMLRWKWRVHTLPGGRENVKNQSNSAAGVYVLFRNGGPVGNSIKYIWSSELPAGTILRSPFSSRTALFVLRTGKSQIGEWVAEERNVVEDYRRAFGGKPGELRGIAVMSSSDNTHTSASADYDDFFGAKPTPAPVSQQDEPVKNPVNQPMEK